MCWRAVSGRGAWWLRRRARGETNAAPGRLFVHHAPPANSSRRSGGGLVEGHMPFIHSVSAWAEGKKKIPQSRAARAQARTAKSSHSVVPSPPHPPVENPHGAQTGKPEAKPPPGTCQQRDVGDERTSTARRGCGAARPTDFPRSTVQLVVVVGGDAWHLELTAQLGGRNVAMRREQMTDARKATSVRLCCTTLTRIGGRSQQTVSPLSLFLAAAREGERHWFSNL